MICGAVKPFVGCNERGLIRSLPDSLPRVLARYRLASSDGREEQAFNEFESQMRFVTAVARRDIGVAELGRAVHTVRDADLLADKSVFSDGQWDRLVSGFNQLSNIATARLCYHYGNRCANPRRGDHTPRTHQRQRAPAARYRPPVVGGGKPLEILRRYPRRIRPRASEECSLRRDGGPRAGTCKLLRIRQGGGAGFRWSRVVSDCHEMFLHQRVSAARWLFRRISQVVRVPLAPPSNTRSSPPTLGASADSGELISPVRPEAPGTPWCIRCLVTPPRAIVCGSCWW